MVSNHLPDLRAVLLFHETVVVFTIRPRTGKSNNELRSIIRMDFFPTERILFLEFPKCLKHIFLSRSHLSDNRFPVLSGHLAILIQQLGFLRFWTKVVTAFFGCISHLQI